MATPGIDARIKHSLYGPPVAHAAADSVCVNTKLCGPLDDSLPLAVKIENMVKARIVALLAICRPSAIIRAVWAVVVYAIKSVSFRPFAHVVQEVLESLHPPIANGYTAPAVVAVFRAVLIVATRPHLVICSAQRVPRQTMPVRFLGSKLSLQAPATSVCPVLQLRRSNGAASPAFALTKPVRRPIVIKMRKADGSPSAKLHPRQVLTPAQPRLVTSQKLAWLAFCPSESRRSVLGYVRLLTASAVAVAIRYLNSSHVCIIARLPSAPLWPRCDSIGDNK
jgi:hypothetical protein